MWAEDGFSLRVLKFQQWVSCLLLLPESHPKAPVVSKLGAEGSSALRSLWRCFCARSAQEVTPPSWKVHRGDGAGMTPPTPVLGTAQWKLFCQVFGAGGGQKQEQVILFVPRNCWTLYTGRVLLQHQPSLWEQPSHSMSGHSPTSFFAASPPWGQLGDPEPWLQAFFPMTTTVLLTCTLFGNMEH